MERFADEAKTVLAAILEQSQDCIKLLDPQGGILYMNANGQRAVGVEDFASVAGRPWADLWPEENRGQIEDALDKARRGQRVRFEALRPSEGGSQQWWDVSVAPVREKDGRLTHILATSRDVTPHMNRRLDDQMRREAAEQDAHFAEDVAREMRHRLKNQLAVVGSVSKLLSRHSDSAADLHTKLERKLTALARAQDLLTVHRDQPILANEAIEQVLGASGAGERVRVESIPEVRLGDDGIQQLALLLGELQTNALKYGALSEGERGSITLSGAVAGNSLKLVWDEDTGAEVAPPSGKGAGLLLIERLGTSGDGKGAVEWSPRGPCITLYLRTAA